MENPRQNSLALPEIHSDSGSAFISMEFCIVLKENGLTHKKILPHTPEQNGIIEGANMTVREEISPVIITDYQDAKREISKIVHWYNNERMYSSLNYLTPRDCYRESSDELLYMREDTIRIGGMKRKVRNMNKRKGR